jgi:hypothetical protein
VATATGAVVAAAIVLANLSRGKVDGLDLLLVPAIPTVVAGQLWGIALLLGRRNRTEGARPKWRFRRTERDPRRLFFQGLPPRCRYRLVNHGEYTCVSRSTYIAARDAEQRLVAGVLGGFFVVQFGSAAAELRRRRVAASQVLA